MILLRLLNPQGMAGIAASIILALLLLVQKGETRHWHKQSGEFEQLYRAGQSSLAATVANYRAAAAEAATADRANADRVAAEQHFINERTANDYQGRIAAVHALARRLRVAPASAGSDFGGRPGAPVPGLPAPAGGAAEAAGEDRLSASDREVATDQAIQLDELIKWVRQQHAVRVDGMPGERQAAAKQSAVDSSGNR